MSEKVERLVTKTTVSQNTVKLTREMMLEFLAKKLCHGVVPRDATVRFVVPRGGDYSGTAVDITSEDPIWVEWTVTATTEDVRL